MAKELLRFCKELQSGPFIAPSAGMWNHWVFRACAGFQPFSDFEIARRTWFSLAKAFPQMLAAVLMPNHCHLILPSPSPLTSSSTDKDKYHQLGGILSQIKGVRWERIPPPSVIPDPSHLRRQLRYVALNPCRKGLCKDPLEWVWSTYREVMGAVVYPTVQVERLASPLGESKAKFRVRFHAYVSGDPSVQIGGTPPPIRLTSEELKYKSLHQILFAAAAALRVSPAAIHLKGELLRPLFIHLAHRYGWGNRPTLLAEMCGMSRSAVNLIKKQLPPQGMDMAELCLSDERLQQGIVLPKCRVKAGE